MPVQQDNRGAVPAVSRPKPNLTNVHVLLHEVLEDAEFPTQGEAGSDSYGSFVAAADGWAADTERRRTAD